MPNKLIDLTGKKQGSLTVLKRCEDYVFPNGQKIPNWKVRCDCGKEYSITGDRFRGLKPEKCIECKNNNQRLMGKMSGLAYSRIREGAKKRELEFDEALTKDFLFALYEKQNRKCALTNLPIVFADTLEQARRSGSTASLDRIDSSKGYVVGNVQWVDKRINIMKRDMDQQQFLLLCKLVVDKTEFTSKEYE